MAPSNSKMTGANRRSPASTPQLSLVNTVAPSRSRAAELREYQPQTIGISLGELAAQGIFRNSICGGPAPQRRREPDAARRQRTLEDLHNTLQLVLDIVAEDDT